MRYALCVMRIIIGLGNPGEKYINTRHNVGFMAIDAMVKKLGLNWENNKKLNSQVIKDGDTIYAKPNTFMNNSGQSIQAIMSYYKLLPKKLGCITIKNSDLSDSLTIIHDDLDIELGKYKMSVDSRSAGHKGVESIINYLKTKNFKRVRIGIKNNKPEQMPVENYVLQKFKEEELVVIHKLISNLNF